MKSMRCKFAQWSYLTEIGIPGVPDHGVHLLSTLPEPPPYFVHVLVYGTRPSQFDLALPHGHPPSDRLVAAQHPPACGPDQTRALGRSSRRIVLAPSYPSGGESGGHLIFAYQPGAIVRGISVHPWTSIFRYRVGHETRSLTLAPGPAYPQIQHTLRAIVNPTL
jgi:hypothetical protein